MADRTDSLNGWIWADGAGDPPAVPVTGVTYASSSLVQATVEEGWPYSEVVNSANFNEIMRRATSIISLLETYGIIPWSALTTYPVGAVVTGSDGLIYKALLISTSASPKDPIANPTYWRPEFVPATSSLQGLVELATNTETQTGTDTERAITPAGLASFAQLLSAAGYKDLPGGFIIQWGTIPSTAANTLVTVTLSKAFPTAGIIAISCAVSSTTSSAVAMNFNGFLSTSQIRFHNSSAQPAPGVYIALGY